MFNYLSRVSAEESQPNVKFCTQSFKCVHLENETNIHEAAKKV